MPTYFEKWRTDDFDCPKCKWRGKGSELRQGELYDYCYEVICPSCEEHITAVQFPSIQEALDNQDKLSEDERRDVLAAKRRRDEYERVKLHSPSDLPDIHEPAFILTWDVVWKSERDQIEIKHGDKVIFTEPGGYEEYEKFIEVARIVRERYGEAVRDLVPTEASRLNLYGDKLGSPGHVEIERKRNFGPQAGDEPMPSDPRPRLTP